MTDTVFQEKQVDQPDNSTAFSEAEQPASHVEQLVGEGKKYASVELLAKSRIDADNHIKKLESELAELRQTQAELRTREDILEELKSLTSSTSARETTRDVTTDEPQANPTVGNGVDVEALLEQMLTGREQEKEAKANEKYCSDKLREVHGEGAEKVLIAKAEELGVSIESLRQDAAMTPRKFLALFGIEGKRQEGKATVATPTTTVNTESENFQTGGAPKYGTKAYFEKLRRDNPREYWKPTTQAAILKAHKDGLYLSN